jgi:DNA-binding GntR family transcriptional regulator
MTSRHFEDPDMDSGVATREPKASSGASRLAVKPIDTTTSFRMQAYQSLKRAILEMDVYDHPGEIRLDERQLSHDLGVSRTPIREAMSLLEQEGFVKTLPRRGVFVVRKTKREIVEMILVWAALESMAARLVCVNATEDEIASLRHLFDGFRNGEHTDHLQEYSEANIAFHSAIIRLSKCQLIADLTKNLFIHMRAIRKVTISEDNRAQRSIQDHMAIIEALEARDVERAERLVRQHSLDLAAHVETHCHHLD